MTRIHFEVSESRACDWRKPCLRLAKAEDGNGKEGISMF